MIALLSIVSVRLILSRHHHTREPESLVDAKQPVSVPPTRRNYSNLLSQHTRLSDLAMLVNRFIPKVITWKPIPQDPLLSISLSNKPEKISLLTVTHELGI